MKAIDVIKIRKNLNLTQAEFGKLIGVDKRTIINYEQGKGIPESRVTFLKTMLASGIGINPIDTNQVTNKKVATIIEDKTDNLENEIEFLKDYIVTLKKFLEEKSKLSDLYEIENNILKEKIKTLTNDQNIL